MSKAFMYAFGEFRLDGQDRTLHRGSQSVPLGDRAMDLLLLLVRHAAQVISKQDLISHAWPTSTVDESTLRFHISMLRKALGEGQQGTRYISNVSGRGYCFVATLAPGANELSAETTRPRPLPRQTVPPVGRDTLLGELQAMLPSQRFVTLAGSGGMGKSTVAMALAEQMAPCYADGVQIVDVPLLGDGSILAPTLARQLGVPYSPGGVIEALQRWMADRCVLIILDSCEAQLESCAVLAQALLEHSSGMHLLCTSREPLRARGEWVLRLPPLELPPPATRGLSLQAALAFPALQLLVARAKAAKPDLQIDDTEVDTLCELGQRLDGMPLAIELAAVRLDALPLADLLKQLQSRFLLHSTGHRTSTDRHRTLASLLDWSHERLTPQEQTVLRRVSVCAGSFSLATAQAVAADEQLGHAGVMQSIMGLASKSLLAVDMDAGTTRYRLLDTTRAYALDKLGHSDELHATRVRQCTYLREHLDIAESDWARLSPRQWFVSYAPFSHDVRGALAWAFGPGGDTAQGISLVSAGIALGHQLSLSEEYRIHLGAALKCLREMDSPDPALELRLSMALSSMLMLSQGPGPETYRLYQRALEISKEFGGEAHLAAAINGCFVQAYFGDGDYLTASHHARAAAEIAVRAPELHLQTLVERLTTQALHGSGRHDEARLMVESSLRHPPPRQRLKPPFPIDQPVMMRMILARILWLQGQADQAWQVAEELLELATHDVRFALSNALAWTVCPLALWMGAHRQARECIDLMYHHACDINMPFAVSWASAYDRVLATRLGEQPRLQGNEVRVQEASATGVVAELLATLDWRRLTPALLARHRAGTLGWCEPEIVRAQGELHLASGGDVQGAQALFEHSLKTARQQGALAWELRAATSLAQLWAGQEQGGKADELLAPLLERFSEGASTADIRRARALLDTPSAGRITAETSTPHRRTIRDTGRENHDQHPGR